MACVAIVLPSIEIGRKLVAPAMFLMLPLALVLWFGYSARKQTKEEERKAVWLGYRRLSRVMAVTLAGWWATWDLNHLADALPPFVPWLSSSLAPSSVEPLLFWIPPIVSLGRFLALTYIVLFWFRREFASFRPQLDALIILAPLATGYFVSRRHECCPFGQFLSSARFE